MNIHMESEDKRKLKLIAVTIGMLMGFYFFFGYIFPIIWPLVLSFVLAAVCYPAVNGMYRFFKINKMVGTLILLALLTVGAGWLLGLFIGKLTDQIGLFAANLPMYQKSAEKMLGGVCTNLDSFLHLSKGCAYEYLNGGINDILKRVQPKIMQFLLGTSLPMVRSFMDVIVIGATVLVAFFLFIKGMEEMKEKAGKSLFHKELRYLGNRAAVVCRAYLKAQLIIIAVVAVCAIAGLTLAGNHYAWLAGSMIGILDALPLLGSGMILIPMTLLALAKKEFLRGAILFTTFMATYFAREYLEPKLMGEKMGVSPLTTLMGIFIGYRLFGFFGMFAGALAVIVYTDIIKLVKDAL